MKKLNKNFLTAIFVLFSLFGFSFPVAVFAAGPVVVNLGTAGNYVILSKTQITTTGATSITGNIAVSPADSTFIQGFGLSLDGSGTFSTSSLVSGNVYAADYTAPTPATLTTAVSAMEAAYTDASGRPTPDGTNLYAGIIGGQTFTPGLYKWTTDVTIPTNVTLSGSASDVWIFQIDGNLDISANKKIILSGGALTSNIFWAVAGTTTLEAGSTFEGTILAGPSTSTVAMQSGATLHGRALGQKEVTLIATTISALAPSFATLDVIKHVVNDNGGVAVASAWNLAVTSSNGGSGTGSAVGAEAPGTTYTLQSGKAYGVAESGGPSGYTQSSSSECTIANAVSGNTYTCTITNDDQAPSLTLHKTIVTDNGGTALNTAWTLTATGASGSPTNLSGSTPVASGASFKADTYTLAESAGPSGYTPSVWSCTNGVVVNGSSQITLALGQTTVCTISNDDIPPTITVTKVVVGGIKANTDFPLFVNGSPVVHGVTNIFPVGAYVVTETDDSKYVRTFSGNCDSSGNLSLTAGDIKTCVITNTLIPPQGSGAIFTSVVPPLIEVLKVPSPLALPGGPGSVTYTYTLRNIGTVPVTNVTMVGDSCSPVTFTSGDTNGDSKLDLNESWVYHCTTTLLKTHTNTITATGWANGISAVDIASATVVVGLPAVPPLIHVTKIPNPLSLPASGGVVTYTEKVTNLGTVPLVNVNVVDDKCSPVNYISGDTNGNSRIENTETWVYACETNLAQTTTNTVTASGDANGLTSRDFAIATVVVAAPGFPKTGFSPQKNNSSYVILFIGVLALGFGVFLVLRKRKI
jgi:uncharacterized repeat protein (TIGR01451 family)